MGIFLFILCFIKCKCVPLWHHICRIDIESIRMSMNYNELNFDAMTREQGLSMSAAFPALMRKVYVWMALALVITGATAYGVATSPGILTALFSNQLLFWGLIIAEFALVIGITAAINRISLTTATLMFILYSVINGAVLSSIFVIYTMSSIASVFFITAGTFSVMALIGYTTKTDLTSMGKILFMALIGIIIATVGRGCTEVGFAGCSDTLS